MSEMWTILITLALLGAVAVLSPMSLPMGGFGAQDVIDTLTALFLVSLVLERAIEVFVSTWRRPDAESLALSIRRARKRLQEARKRGQGVEEAETALRPLEAQEQQYRTGTRIFAIRIAFLFGIAVSVVGVRALESVLMPGSLSNLDPTQKALFNIVDVVMTGGVIAGGSDAIHKILRLFTVFMDASTKRVEASIVEPEVVASTEDSQSV